MNAINYDKRMQEELRGAQDKRLLLHSCCAPCSSHCLSELSPQIGVTVFYYNPNLDCAEEYEKRKREQIRFLRETGLQTFWTATMPPRTTFRRCAGWRKKRRAARGARCASACGLIGRRGRQRRAASTICDDAHRLSPQKRQTHQRDRFCRRGGSGRTISSLRFQEAGRVSAFGAPFRRIRALPPGLLRLRLLEGRARTAETDIKSDSRVTRLPLFAIWR